MMEKSYDPSAIEQRWYEAWERSGMFAPAGDGEGAYCIMIPPPNVTGSLHMGHAFQDTLMDCLIRLHRMRGEATLWQAGTDHAGIATQMVVERQLNGEGVTRHDLGRDAFLDRVWQWKGESGGTITRQLRRMGASLDWQNERFTMDDGLSHAVREVFVKLHEEGLIYRGKRLVNWDPVLHTAVSDLEVLNEEEQGKMWHFRYPLSSGEGALTVATTRPETMLGDSAVAVHPGDERYRHLIGQQVELPLTGRTIPIIADEYVDPEFGTGCVKITPAHDFNDYAVGQRHQLPLINIFTIDASINDEAPAAYRGLDRYEARRRIVDDLTRLGLVDRIDDHRLMVPRGDRSGSVIEPFLTDQWYVRVEPLAREAIAAVESGRIRFVPENWSKTYYQWMNNIEDWCISRQLWWGHRIPAWYDDQGNLYVGRDEDEVRSRNNIAPEVELRQDEDVLDTWFSSALWPFSTLGWPDETRRLQQFYPTSVLVTGFDIIFFWVARMIMMGIRFMGDVPFREVYIHGLIRDAHGQKMSKSKGNVLDPIDLIDGIDLESLVSKRTTGLMQPQMRDKIERNTRKEFPDGIPAFGTDALRFTFASQASTGRDINFDMGRIEGNRNFCNKLWNAARYVMMNCEGHDCGYAGGEQRLSVIDRWIVSRLDQCVATVNQSLTSYRFDLAAQAIYEFIWHDFCDWYLELAKPILGDGEEDEASRRGTRHTLLEVLEETLRLAHPVMPFITEEIWQQIRETAGRGQEQTIMLQPYPVSSSERQDAAACAEVEWIKLFVMGIRKIRSTMNIAPGKPLPLLLAGGGVVDRDRSATFHHYLIRLARLEKIEWLDAASDEPDSATALVGELRLLIPMAGLIDKEAELARLEKEIKRLEADRERTARKLENPGFTDKAPAAVVDKERSKLEESRLALEQLHGQLERIRRL